jgi:hypothetical protein
LVVDDALAAIDPVVAAEVFDNLWAHVHGPDAQVFVYSPAAHANLSRRSCYRMRFCSNSNGDTRLCVSPLVCLFFGVLSPRYLHYLLTSAAYPVYPCAIFTAGCDTHHGAEPAAAGGPV